MIRWQRAGWRLFWKMEVPAWSPRIPVELRTLIRRMARENPVWGKERIASELFAHPSAEWTLQQLREVVGYEDRYRYLIHDRDSIFAKHLDESLKALGLSVLK